MMENGVAALPVYDNATNEPLGIADVRLIASYLVWTKFRVGDGVDTAPDPSVDFAKQLVASLLPSSSRPLVCLKGTRRTLRPSRPFTVHLQPARLSRSRWRT